MIEEENLNTEETPTPKKRGRPKGIPHSKNENFDFTPCSKNDVKKEFMDSLKAEDVLLNRPARRPSKVEQLYREELLREEIRKLNNDRTWYFLISVAMNYLNVTSYKSIAVQAKKSFLSYQEMHNLFGNPDSFAILSIIRLEKDEYEEYNSTFQININKNIGII
jgi:hypothetical protein